MKKVIIVNTSPRTTGNCPAIPARLEEKITDADVEIVDFAKSNINYCQGCDACMAKDAVWCVQEDDMSALLPDLDSCDALVLLSPIYWGDVCAQAKTFVDRLYAFFNPAKPNMTVATKAGKKGAVIVTCGMGDIVAYRKEAANIAGSLSVSGFTEFKALGFNEINEPGSVTEHADYLQQIDDLAAWLSA